MDLFGAAMRLPDAKLVLWDVFCYLRQFNQAGKQNSLKFEKLVAGLSGVMSQSVGDHYNASTLPLPGEMK